MTTTPRSMVMGVFEDESQVQQVMNDLQSAGFSNDQISYSVRKSSSGITNALENLGFFLSRSTQGRSFARRAYSTDHWDRLRPGLYWLLGTSVPPTGEQGSN